VEPLPTNCLTAEINPQTVTYVRTKMTRLTQDPETLNGKISTNINRMQTSRPTKSDRGAGNKISGMRFTAENVEQYDDKVYHNTVVCELYRASTGSQWGIGDGDGLVDNQSVAEMIFHFSDDGLKDRTPQEWAMASHLRGFKQKGLQGIKKNPKEDEDGHWFGRRSTINRTISKAPQERFTFMDKLRRAPRATAFQSTTRRQTNWDNVNAWKAKQKTKIVDENEYDDVPRKSSIRKRKSMIAVTMKRNFRMTQMIYQLTPMLVLMTLAQLN